MSIKKIILKEPQPQACQECNKESCSNCKYWQERWQLVEGENLTIEQLMQENWIK